MNLDQCIQAIETLTKEEFYQTIFKPIASTQTFSTLVTIGPKYLTEDEKKEICGQLTNACIPARYEQGNDHDLQELARHIASRAIQVR